MENSSSAYAQMGRHVGYKGVISSFSAFKGTFGMLRFLCGSFQQVSQNLAGLSFITVTVIYSFALITCRI